MASNRPSTVTLTCDDHKNSVVAICFTHHKLICVSCLIEKKHSNECEIKQTKDCQDGRWKCLFEHATTRQKAIQLKDELVTARSSTSIIKEKLLQEIEDLHRKLLNHLNQKLAKTKDSIEKKVGDKEKEMDSKIDTLEDCKTDLDTNFEKLQEEGADLNECSGCLANITRHLNTSENEDGSDIDGCFNPHEWTEVFCKDETPLGNVEIFYINIYEEENADKTAEVLPESIYQRHIDAGLDQVIYPNMSLNVQHDFSGLSIDTSSPTPASLSEMVDSSQDLAPKQGTLTEHTESQASQPDATRQQDIQNAIKPDVELPQASNKKRPPSFGLLEKQHVSANETQLGPSTSSQQLTDYADKRLKIPDIESSLAASKYSQIVHLGDSNVALLCPAESTVLVTALPNGPTATKKLPGTIYGIVATGTKTLAALIGEQNQTSVFKVEVKNNKLDASRLWGVPKTITDISGFGFDVKTSMYAISSPSMRTILDKNGKVIKTLTIQEANVDDSTNIQSVYDFESDQIVYLNVANKTFKSYSCQNDEVNLLWKKKCNDDKFTPSSMCLHRGVIYIASGSSIPTFAAKDGSPYDNIETNSILPDCLAVCAIDDVLMWTSSSDDPDLSTRIGFI